MAWEWIENTSARVSLRNTAYFQYPWLMVAQANSVVSLMVNYRINVSIGRVENNKTTINSMATKYGIPNEIIGSIIFKEQLTQSIPDLVANIDSHFRSVTHSTGLGAIFPSTARSAWTVVNPYMILPSSNSDLQYKLSSDNEFNIETIAVVLVYEAINKGLISTVNEANSLSLEQWKGVVAKYNGSDEYANKVYEYLSDIEELLD